MKRGDIVRVVWTDAHSIQGWSGPHEIDRTIQDPLSKCIHAGLFIAKTKTALILTFGISAYGNCDGTIEIPLSCIESTKILEASMLEKM